MKKEKLETIELMIIDVIAEVFDVGSSRLSGSSGPTDIEDWDSIGYVRLLMAFEDEFGIEIPIEIALSLTSISQFAEYISNNWQSTPPSPE